MKTHMKFLAVVVIVGGSVASANLSVDQIERMVEKIHLKRPGISLDKLEQTKEPFIVLKKTEVQEGEKPVVEVILNPRQEEDNVQFALHALMNGRAYINDGWKKEGDMVLGYKVVHIGKRGVVLRRENRIKTLFLPKKKKSLISLGKGE